MADAKISDLTAAGSLAVGDLFVVVDISDTTDAGSGTTKKATGTQVFTLFADTDGTLAANSDTVFPTQKAVKTYAQPLDGTLTALAAQNWVANALPIGSGADTLAQVSFAANTFPARASTGDLVAKTITDFGLSILDDTSAAAVRTTLVLGTAAVKNTGTSGDAVPLLNASNEWSASTGQAFIVSDTGTNDKKIVIAESRTTSGAPSPGFGIHNHIYLKSSTTDNQDAATDTVEWATSTHASRKARRTFGIHDQSTVLGTQREVLRMESSGSAAMIGFLGASAAVQQTGDVSTALVTFGLMSGTPTVPWAPTYLSGMTLSNSSGSPNTVIDVALGYCRDASNNSNITLAATTKTLNSSGSWTAGGAANGLDTGARANSTWYHVYVISQALGANPDILFSLSATAPTMPSTYTLKRRIGAIKTDGSGNILAFVQRGNHFLWSTPLADVAASNPGTSAVTRTLVGVPTGVRVEALLSVGFSASALADNPAYIYISDLSVADITPNINSPLTFSAYSATALVNNSGAQARVFTNTSAQVRSRVLISSTNTVLHINTNGWIDDLAGATGAQGATGAAGPTGSGVLANVIDNGNFAVWQRGASFAAIAAGAVSADRYSYQLPAGAAVHTITRSTDVPTVAQAGSLSLYSLKIDCTTADASIAATDRCFLNHAVEGYDFLAIAQREFTLSFWVKATKTGVYCVAFRNNGADRSYIAEYTVNVTATWEYKTITVPASPTGGTWDYTTGVGLNVGWALNCGSTYQTTANAWQTGNFVGTASQVNATDSTANDFYLSQIMLVPGSTAYPIQPTSYSDDLAKCQRYLQSYSGLLLGLALNASVLYHCGAVTFPCEMRAAPTLVAGATYTVNAGSAGTPSLANTTNKGTGFVNASANWTTNAIVAVTCFLTAEI